MRCHEKKDTGYCRPGLGLGGWLDVGEGERKRGVPERPLGLQSANLVRGQLFSAIHSSDHLDVVGPGLYIRKSAQGGLETSTWRCQVGSSLICRKGKGAVDLWANGKSTL